MIEREKAGNQEYIEQLKRKLNSVREALKRATDSGVINDLQYKEQMYHDSLVQEIRYCLSCNYHDCDKSVGIGEHCTHEVWEDVDGEVTDEQLRRMREQMENSNGCIYFEPIKKRN